MRNQERCFLRSVAGFCLLLGGVILFSSSNLVVPAAAAAATDDQSSQIFTTTSTITTALRDGDDDDLLAVKPLRGEESSPKDSKLKELDSKMILESKKKPVGEFKVKPDQKYSKSSKDEDTIKLNKSGEHEQHVPTITTMSPMSATDKTNFTVPLLFHGVPLVTTFNVETSTTLYSSTTEDDTVGGSLQEIRTTEETLVSSRGRALNISAPEPTNSLHANLTDLSDVSMDDDDKEVEGGEYVAPHNATISISNSTLTFVTSCTEGNRTYDIGEPIIRGCNEKCVCGGGGEAIKCEPMCHFPYFKAGTGSRDPLCQESVLEDQPCCAMLVCEADSALEPDETCVFGNKTVTRGQRVEDGCARICVCEAGGHLKCQARCPPNETNSTANQHDRCVALTDPRDACCTITLCDVTLGDHEIKPENSTELTINITDIKVLNSTSIKLKLTGKHPEEVVIELSDNNHVWRQQNPDKDGVITNLEPAHTYYVRVTENGRNGPALQVTLPAEVIKANISEKLITDHNVCIYRGKSYKIGTNWYDECISFCSCAKDGKAECVTIECPTDFGLDVLDPHCLDWETVPANFVPKAPQCCPQEVRCRNNGSCSYEGKVYDNWSELPSNVTGCEKRCYCEMGNVSCQAACPPVPAVPPPNLQCPPHQASLVHAPDDECCLRWACAHPPSQIPGKNATSALTSPSATTSNDIDKSHNKSQDKSNQEPDHGVSFPPSSWEDTKPQTFDITTNNNHGPLIHYPMDPGHPTVPYNGPYNPDYKPTHPSVENVFHLPSPPPPPSSSSSSSSSPSSSSSTTTSIHVDSKPSITKDKTSSKPKLEQTKKPIEPMKPHQTKDTSSNVPQYFPGPLAPDKFPDKMIPSVDHKIHSENPNKLAPPVQKGTFPNVVPQHPSPDQPHFIPLNPQGPTSPADSSFPFAPHNGENIPPGNFDHIQYENSAVGPPYGGDPNFIITNPSKVNPKKKQQQQQSPHDDLVDKTKTSSLPGKPKQNQRNPEQDILPDELYHLINLQHPGLIHLEHAPPQGHPGLYEIHQQHITSGAAAGQRQPAAGYFGTAPTQVPKKSLKPHIFAQKNPENGETTYHIHTPEIPSSQQQIEELLAHISQHDSNPGPFQQYPGQPAIPHNIGPSGPSLPLHVDAHTSHSGLTHLNHPFAAQTPDQSGLDHNVHPGFPVSGFPVQPPNEEITVQTLDALNEHTVRLVFTVPQVLVGLHGRVELRYTSDKLNLDPSTWRVQVFAPPNDLIATPQLEFELGDLKPSTEYKVKITVKLKDLANSPTSRIYSVRTFDKRPEITTLPPQIPIDAELRVMETNSSWVNVMWKKFTEYELQFIDGVQLRYKEKDSKVYAATPLIHRAVTNYVIENLKPATTYEIGIYVIPFPGQNTELISEKEVQVTTLMEPDPYSFDVKVEIKTIKSTDVEVSWSGVPYPEDKYVNIYRAIYQSDSGKEDTSTFKIAKRDSPAKTMITDLKPGTRYRLWIEVYLTNGKIKKSNVQDFVTKPGVLLPASVSQQAGKLASISLHEGDYYGPLVIVAIVASLAILSTLILLMMLMKRRTSSKADISPRKTTSAYDNPSYKTCEDAVPVTNGRNKISDHEMATININAKDAA